MFARKRNFSFKIDFFVNGLTGVGKTCSLPVLENGDGEDVIDNN
jgi:hypothetical protein